MALIRYPGSKEKLAKDLWRLFPDEMKHSLWATMSQWEYREPFFGAGAIGFKILPRLDRRSRVWLNDIDADLVLLWQTVSQHPKRIARLITEFTPTVDKFYEFKSRDGVDDCEPSERGFRKLALHRMSVSGFGVKSGGPIGGKTQSTSQYTVGCRWNPERLKRDVFRLSAILSRFESLLITCGDFEQMVTTANANTFIYLDPPYYEKGEQLYRHNMTDACHERLSLAVRSTAARWVLSYDDHPRIRELYPTSTFHDLFITYTNATKAGRRPKNREVAIVPAEAA